MLKRIFSSLAADFMGPFTSINYICEIMLESKGCIDKAMLENNCIIMKNAAKIASIKTKTFLDLNMILNKTFMSMMTTCRPVEMAQEIAGVMDQHMKSRYVKLDIKSKEFSVACDQNRVEQVLLNMLSQAINSSVRQSTIEVSFMLVQKETNKKF